MNLKLAKELEDLKIIERNLSFELKQKHCSSVAQFIDKAISDFICFFKEHKFNVETKGLTTTATYGDLNATIEKQNPNEEYIYPRYFLNLTLCVPNKSIFIVIVESKAKKINSNPDSFNSTDETLNDSVKNEIIQTQTKINKLKSQLKNFQDNSYTLRLRNNDKTTKTTLHASYDEKVYDSMIDLLSSLCE